MLRPCGSACFGGRKGHRAVGTQETETSVRCRWGVVWLLLFVMLGVKAAETRMRDERETERGEGERQRDVREKAQRRGDRERERERVGELSARC